jgi:hypothetical protein
MLALLHFLRDASKTDEPVNGRPVAAERGRHFSEEGEEMMSGDSADCFFPAARRLSHTPRNVAPRSLFAVALLALAVSMPGVADRAHAQSACVPGPGDRPETGLQGQVPPTARQPPGGFQGFWCGMNKVGQNTLLDRGIYGATAIWDHCAYSSVRDPADVNLPTTGVAVLDVSVPAQPKIVGPLLRTQAMLRAYQGLRTQSGILLGSGQDRTNVDVYDISQDCLNPRLKSSRATPPRGGLHEVQDNHGGWLTYDGKTFWGVPYIGRNILIEPTRVDVHAVNLDDPANPVDVLSWNRLELPAAVMNRTASTSNFHDVTTNFDGTRIYMALYGQGSCANGLMIMDSSDVARRRPDPALRFVSFLSWCDQPTAAYGDGSSASAHTTQYVVHRNGKPYIVTTDEGPTLFQVKANGNCLQRSYSRLIDISDETKPRIVATWNPQVNDAATCSAGAADQLTYYPHYIGVDSKDAMTLVFYASYWSGVRVVDFGDPEHPKEIAYYNAPRHPTLTPAASSDHSAPPIPYDAASCFIYTGWTDNGLIILELKDPTYNPCLRKAATGGGMLAGGGHIRFDFDANRTGGTGALAGGLQLDDRDSGITIRVSEVTSLGSVRNACGTVRPGAHAVEFTGDGAFNGAAASFRVCIQDNGAGDRAEADQFFLTCTAGCSYSADGTVDGGSIHVRQQ